MKILSPWINLRKCPREQYVFWDIFVITLLISLFTPSLSNGIEEFKFPERTGPNDFDYKVINSFVKNGGKGILTAFKGDPEMRGTQLQLSYFLKEGQPFKGDFMIGNYTDEPVEYFIICLINYNQQEFLFNGMSSFSENPHIVSK